MHKQNILLHHFAQCRNTTSSSEHQRATLLNYMKYAIPQYMERQHVWLWESTEQHANKMRNNLFPNKTSPGMDVTNSHKTSPRQTMSTKHMEGTGATWVQQIVQSYLFLPVKFWFRPYISIEGFEESAVTKRLSLILIMNSILSTKLQQHRSSESTPHRKCVRQLWRIEKPWTVWKMHFHFRILFTHNSVPWHSFISGGTV